LDFLFDILFLSNFNIFGFNVSVISLFDGSVPISFVSLGFISNTSVEPKSCNGFRFVLVGSVPTSFISLIFGGMFNISFEPVSVNLDLTFCFSNIFSVLFLILANTLSTPVSFGGSNA